jgi:hypothetical protein
MNDEIKGIKTSANKYCSTRSSSLTKIIFEKKKKFIFIKLILFSFLCNKQTKRWGNDERMKIIGASEIRLNKHDKKKPQTDKSNRSEE